MRFCNHCGAKMQDGVRFCPQCGRPSDAEQPQSDPSSSSATLVMPRKWVVGDWSLKVNAIDNWDISEYTMKVGGDNTIVLGWNS